MRRGVKLGIAVLLIGLLLGLYLYLANRPAEAPESGVRDERIDLAEAEGRELVKIEALGGTASDLTLVKEGELWLMDVPWRDELNQNRLMRVARSSASLTADRLLEESPEDLARYGLDEPRRILRLSFEDGSSREFMVGDATPSGTKRYLKRKEAEPVYTVADYFLRDFFQGPDAFRIKSVAGINPQELTLLKIEGPEETIEIVPAESLEELPPGSLLSALVMVSPVGPRGVDTQAFGEMAQSIPPSFSAVEIIDEYGEDLSPFGLDSPRYQVRMRGGERELAFQVGDQNPEGNLFVRFDGDDRILTIPPDQLAFMGTDSFSLMEKFVLIINIDLVDSIAIRYQGEEYTARIERSGSEEETEERYYLDEAEIGEDAFKEFYQDLIGIIADAPNRGESDRGEAELELEYRLNSEGNPRLSTGFVPIDRDFYAAYRDGESLFLVSTQQIEAAVDSLTTLTE